MFVLILLLVILFWAYCRACFKIGYYETKLLMCGVDISEVMNMPWWKLWLN